MNKIKIDNCSHLSRKRLRESSSSDGEEGPASRRRASSLPRRRASSSEERDQMSDSDGGAVSKLGLEVSKTSWSCWTWWSRSWWTCLSTAWSYRMSERCSLRWARTRRRTWFCPKARISTSELINNHHHIIIVMTLILKARNVNLELKWTLTRIMGNAGRRRSTWC